MTRVQTRFPFRWTAVYSGLLRMADLLALQPNMDIRLHIVARRTPGKNVREMTRPVFSLLDRGPLSDSCTYISYESVDTINDIEHLAHTNDGNLKLVMQTMGQKDVKTAMKYQHPELDIVRTALNETATGAPQAGA